ncbi:uncharacterized protein CIMG_12888 [Coccidioides immitis RS]|uniref:Uncharacterized protein n=1 Tax=Coccidioides immitis (strain RS) TaxID=246410 RepID=A0A0D8JSL3_COCIM|nr:uncharacterized protein CIMG_12888 [Coccidioides immitis RS]KJF60340.1 hypothetical protein CIMG_12888 [Coccidioides immitis RS]
MASITKAVTLALLGSSAFILASVEAREPEDPMITPMQAANSCYTATITQPSPHIRCAHFNTEACPMVNCFRAETTSIPCPDSNCPTTPTSISYTPCQTACSPACPTVTISCSSTLS